MDKRLQDFIKTWDHQGNEEADKVTYWNTLLHILGVSQKEIDTKTFINYEYKIDVKGDDSFTGRADAYIPSTRVLIEQKSFGVNLFKKENRPNGGHTEKITPYEQARRYDNHIPLHQKARYIVLSNFSQIVIYDVQDSLDVKPVIIDIKDLNKQLYLLNFLVKEGQSKHLEKEKQVSLQAGELVGKIYNELAKEYDLTQEKAKKSINTLCVRLVFCLYAEDAGLFDSKEEFHDYLEPVAPNKMGRALKILFKVLDTEEDDRLKDDGLLFGPYFKQENPELAVFPYVNGGMFHDEDIIIPPFTDELKRILLEEASEHFDWSDISPTIFGAVFESTLNPETRRQGGMHYTSIENIHKVIDPLFLDELKAELKQIKDKYQKTITLTKRQQDKLIEEVEAYQRKLANLTFFDPACGSGNFLTETYLSLRKLENEAIRLVNRGGSLLETGQSKNVIKVSIQQFFGIEINDFAVNVAKTALWIAESQMMKATQDLFYGAKWKFLPLRTYTHIYEGNALTMDWNDVVPNYACSYIMGNPPFIGYKLQDVQQKQDLQNLNIKAKSIDYVTGWYYKACYFMKGTEIKSAFVSTNSICQGEQVSKIWEPLVKKFDLTILFAYKTFIWNSEAKDKANVHVIIIGFQLNNSNQPKILFSGGLIKKVDHINEYLIPYKDIFVLPSRKPIISGISPMIYGSEPREGNFLIMSNDEARNIASKYSELKPYILEYVSAKDYISNKFRKCLWLVNASPKILRSNNWIIDRLESVKKYREKSKQKTAHAMASQPYLFASIRQPKTNYLLFPIHSSAARRYIPIGYVDKNIIASNACFTVPDASLFTFGILTSNIHMAWTKVVTGRIKSDFRYSNTLVYNTFPWPTPTKEQKEKIEKTAQGILDARAKYPDSSLADLYDELTMPPELIKAHKANDKAVLEAYGLNKNATEEEIVAHLFEMYSQLTK